MERFKYMQIPIKLFPKSCIDGYILQHKSKDGFVYLDIRNGMYGLPQTGILANKLLKKRLATHKPGLSKHHSQPIQFMLVIDDFGIKYANKRDAEHILHALKDHYKVEIDWTGRL